MSNDVFQKPAGKLESMSKDLGFDIPVDAVALPSKGTIYPPDHPLSNTETVEIKCMTAKEEDLLTSRALIKNGTVITQLLRSCITQKTVDPDELLSGDRNAILIAIRVSGYGPEYRVQIECPDCSEKFVNPFTLNSLKIKRLGAEPVTPNANLFEFVTPISKIRVHFKLLTGKDEAELGREQDAKKKLGSQIDNLVTSRLFHSIVSINGETDKGKLSRMVMNMIAGDAKALRNYMDKIEPGIDMKQEATCTHCQNKSEVDIPLGISFFWPDSTN